MTRDEQQKQIKQQLTIDAYKNFYDVNGDFNKIEKVDYSNVKGKQHIKNEVV